jgi:CDP-6-deoxy-D-xylo-4-hexulose-3-dehydrase
MSVVVAVSDSAERPARPPILHHLAEDTIDAKDVDRLVEWLRTYPRLTKGEVTVEFERKWSLWLGARHSVFCNSGSSANLLMYYALERSGRLTNKRIVVPSVGWVTTIAPALQFGFEPIMCEADSDTYGLDLDMLEDLLKQREPATVMLVHVLGVPHKMDDLVSLKERYGFRLLEDACAAIGASYKGKNVGTFGDMASFSSYFGHQFSTIEGGLVSTDDQEFDDLLRMHRSHGWGKDLRPEKHRELVEKYGIDDFHSPFVFYEPGFNLRSTDLNAYIGIGQVDKIDWIIARRQANHERYCRHFAGKLEFQKAPEESVVCSIHFGALANDTPQRRRIVRALAEAGIETRIFSAGNLGLHPFYTGFFLPNNPSLSADAVDDIAGVVLGAL